MGNGVEKSRANKASRSVFRGWGGNKSGKGKGRDRRDWICTLFGFRAQGKGKGIG